MVILKLKIFTEKVYRRYNILAGLPHTSSYNKNKTKSSQDLKFKMRKKKNHLILETF